MLKTFLSITAIAILCLSTFSTDAEASVIRGKRYYIQLLKEPCGFKGDVMGSYHTKAAWRAFTKAVH